MTKNIATGKDPVFQEAQFLYNSNYRRNKFVPPMTGDMFQLSGQCLLKSPKPEG